MKIENFQRVLFLIALTLACLSRFAQAQDYCDIVLIQIAGAKNTAIVTIAKHGVAAAVVVEAIAETLTC